MINDRHGPLNSNKFFFSLTHSVRSQFQLFSFFLRFFHNFRWTRLGSLSIIDSKQLKAWNFVGMLSPRIDVNGQAWSIYSNKTSEIRRNKSLLIAQKLSEWISFAQERQKRRETIDGRSWCNLKASLVHDFYRNVIKITEFHILLGSER